MEENMNEEALTADGQKDDDIDYVEDREELTDRKSTRLNSSHSV